MSKFCASDAWREASSKLSRCQLKCDCTRAETRFRLSAKRTSPFKSAGASVQSTTGSRGLRISGSNAGYTVFRGSVKDTGYPLHSLVFPSLPLPCVTCAITFQLESTHKYYGPVYKIQSPSLPGAWVLCILCCCRLPVSAFPALLLGL